MNNLSNRPLVSIITVCLNSQRTIQRTIESVLNQTYQNIEYLIIDGCSTDGTLDIINKYIDKISYFKSEPDYGIYDAMNKGISFANGELIGMINSDDWYENDTVENVINCYSEVHNEVVLYGLMKLFKNGKLWMIKSNCHLFLNEGMINHPTCFVSKSIYKNYGFFDLKYKYSSDYDFMLRLIRRDVKFVQIEKILANMDQYGISFDNLDALKETYSILYKYGNMPFRELVVRHFEIYIKLWYKKIFGKKQNPVYS
jgi:glycosyltransferase involved in cell wall biosynthesis